MATETNAIKVPAHSLCADVNEEVWISAATKSDECWQLLFTVHLSNQQTALWHWYLDITFLLN